MPQRRSEHCAGSPRPYPRWPGIRDAGKLGAVCPQASVLPVFGGRDAIESEGCLTRNRSLNTAEKAP
jgi:carboxylesterase type B